MHRDISLTNREHIVSWIDSYIRELYEIRNLLNEESGPDSEAVEQLFENASVERARWLAGVITPGGRAERNAPEIPSFGEAMGEMLMGRKLLEAQRRFFRGGRDSDDARTDKEKGGRGRT